MHEPKFEEKFEDYHEIKFPVTDNRETDETFKLESDMRHSTLFYPELHNKILDLITGKHQVPTVGLYTVLLILIF